MQTAAPGTEISVEVGEVFAIALRPAETAGYRISFSAIPNIEELEEQREASKGFGASPRVLKHFRCLQPGHYSLEFMEKRAWEKQGKTYLVSVICRN